ncbi:MAG: DUF3298 and DUF4163 domain-containing protein [Prevotellaceae bacterium]|jgi:hypothetical protein|nr:DUF3298 and DUF4163 domain-containing protein [Prevotellaceae bacterium]
MRKILILSGIAIVASCFNNKTAFVGTVNFEKIEVSKKSSEFIPDSTYEVSAAYYNPTDAPLYLKDSILKNTRLLFASWFDVKGTFDLNTSVKKHFDEYRRQIEENKLPGHTAFILDISPEEVYQNEHIISFAYNWMIYEGGAHPNSGKFCFVLDKNTGNKVNYRSLTEGHETEFLNIAETEFRTQSGIKADEKIYDIYWFKDGKFHLTDNYTFTSEGLVFCYNPYEIAPYSFGLIQLTLPYEKVEKLIQWP